MNKQPCFSLFIDYYPFGLKHKGYNSAVTSTNLALKKKFGGKEYQDELGLGTYVFHARNYNPTLGRFMSIDPLAEQMRRWSPYNYAFNNPIYWIDLDRMSPTDIYLDQNGHYLGEDGAETNNLRVIYASDYEDTVEENEDDSTTAKATKELQAKSNLVTINKDKIQSDVNDVNNETLNDQTKERQTYLTLTITRGEKLTAEVTSIRGLDGIDDVITTTESAQKSTGVSVMEKGIYIGQVHSHNTSQDPKLVNIPGTSYDDCITACNSNITVYALDSYTEKSSVNVHRTTERYTENNVGTSSNFNCGQDALSIFANKKLGKRK